MPAVGDSSRQVGRISQLMQAQEKLRHELAERISHLTDRLGPILTPGPPQPEGVRGLIDRPDRAITPPTLATALELGNESLSRQIERLDELFGRVEL